MRYATRRVFVGSVLLGSVSAGCIGDDTEPTVDDDPARTPTPTPAGEETDRERDTDQEEAAELYDDAIELLVDTAETLASWAAGDGGFDPESTDALRETLEQARKSLATAADLATGELAAQIGHAKDVAKFQEALVDFYVLAYESEVGLYDGLTFEDDDQHDRAIEAYGHAKDALDRTVDHLDEIRHRHDQLDTEAFDAPDPALEYSGEYTQFVAIDGPGELEVQRLFLDGRIHFNAIFVELEAGFDHWHDEEFAAARGRFEAAAEARQQSREAFDAVREHDAVWSDLHTESLNMIDILEELEDAIEAFVAATHEAEAGNHEESTELFEEGSRILERSIE